MASGTGPPGPRTGTGDPRPGLSWLRLARPGRNTARLRRAAQLALLAGPAGVAELTEDLPQPVVDFREDGRPFGQVHVLDRGESLDDRVDTGVTGGGQSRPNPF